MSHLFLIQFMSLETTNESLFFAVGNTYFGASFQMYPEWLCSGTRLDWFAARETLRGEFTGERSAYRLGLGPVDKFR